MEEVVLRIQLLVLVAKLAAPFTKVFDGLRHLAAFEVLQSAMARFRIQALTLPIHIVALEFEQLVLQAIIVLVGGLELDFLVG